MAEGATVVVVEDGCWGAAEQAATSKTLNPNDLNMFKKPKTKQ